MAEPVHKRGSKAWRRLLRWGGLLAGLCFLLIGAAWLYLQFAGVPSFLTRRLETALGERGLVAEFGRLHLRGFNLVAEQVRLKTTEPGGGPFASIDRAELRLGGSALAQGRLEPIRLIVQQGGVTWQSVSNQPPQQVPVAGLAAVLRFHGRDSLEFQQITGRVWNAQVDGSFWLTNASALRRWPRAKPADQPRIPWPQRLDAWFTRLQQLQLAASSSLHFAGQADGRNPGSLHLEFRLRTPQAAWRGTVLHQAEFQGRIQPGGSGTGLSQLALEIHAERLTGQFGQLQRLQLASRWTGSLTNRTHGAADYHARADLFESGEVSARAVTFSGDTRPSSSAEGVLQTALSAQAAELILPWGGAQSNTLTADLVHSLDLWEPWAAHWSLGLGPVRSRWGGAAQARLSGSLEPRDALAQWEPEERDWGFWSKLAPFLLDWEADVRGVDSPKLRINALHFTGRWDAPELVIPDLRAVLYGGELHGSAALDTRTRELRSQATADFDVRHASALLTQRTRRWLSQFEWTSPPTASAQLRLTLPPWTKRQPRWGDEVLPTLTLAGEFAGSDGAFRKMPVAYARSHFTLTNSIWHLPDLYVRRPDGEADVEYRGSMRTQEYHWLIRQARVNPLALRPLLPEPAAQRVLDQFTFHQPVSVQGEVSGRWHKPESVTFQGQVAASNFTFRGETCHGLSGRVAMTNLVLGFADVLVRHDDQEIRVPSGDFDMPRRVVHVTNAISTMDPGLVTKVIGPKVHAAIRPYHFRTPPTVRVTGTLPTTRIQDARVRFEVAGHDFSYWRLHVPSVLGDLYWHGDSLSISNVQASFYGGELNWRGYFDFSAPPGAELSFRGQIRKADFHALMEDIGMRTNHLAGGLDADVAITSARSADWRSWNGHGKVRLREGFLWDIPIFGFFSPILNGIVPGLGHSPVTSARASFTLKQSVIRTSNLELRSPALRLRYTGSADFKGAVDARVQAEILRDAWGVGKAVSLALWPISKAFEYKMTGTVSQPKTEPVYIPKALLWPLHPVRSLKRLFGRKEPPAPPQEPAGPFWEEETPEP